MKCWGLLLLLVTSGCAASPTAYRAHFASESEALGVRACVDECRRSNDDGADPHECLAACPGFSSHPGDRCTPGREVPGTYCVTVEERIVPSETFWSAVLEGAIDGALHASREPDASSEPTSDTGGQSKSTARETQAHTPARPSVGRSSARSSATRETRRSTR